MGLPVDLSQWDGKLLRRTEMLRFRPGIDPDGVVHVKVALTTSGCPLRAQIQKDVRARVGGLPGVTKVRIEADPAAGIEADGQFVGRTPAVITVQRGALRTLRGP